jgi:formyltetrahydrofolate deformylase
MLPLGVRVQKSWRNPGPRSRWDSGSPPGYAHLGSWARRGCPPALATLLPPVKPMPTATLLLHGPDQKGLVAGVSGFLLRHNANIVDADQHTDREEGVFLQRVEFELEGMDLAPGEVGEAFAPLAEGFGMRWVLRLASQRRRAAILVSREAHCLIDLLARWKMGELDMEVAVVVSNHPDHADVAGYFGVEFRHLPVTPAARHEQEARLGEELSGRGIDLVVLARYMQILSPELVGAYPNQIINIHHSFLPAFAGARPYGQAHERGVKVIGATAHYVTAELDAGPIIEQDVVRVSHRDTVADMVRKGRDLEKVVLARAVRLHLDDRVLVYGKKTVVFD